MMDNKLLVNSKDKTKLYMVDVLNRSCFIVNRDNNITYPKDNVKVVDSIGTLAYVNTEYGIYGILKERKANVCIMWIKKELAESDDKFSKLANSYGSNLMDITEYGMDILEQKWSNKLHKPVIIKNLNFMPMGRNDFLQSIGLITESVELVQEETVDNTQEVIEETEEDNNKVIEEDNNKEKESRKENNNPNNLGTILKNYMSTLEDRLANIIKREEAISIKEAELTEKSNRLNKLLAEYEGNELNHIAETIVDMELVTGLDDNVEDTNIESTNAYEFILKTLNKNDCVTLNKECYSKLKIKIHKSLEANMAYTKYKVLATIRFSSNDTKNILAIVDCDEEKHSYRVIILKKYGNNSLTNIDITKYITEYTKWKAQTFREVT